MQPRTHIPEICRTLRRAYEAGNAPVKQMPSRDPFRILVSAVLSTRTQDPVTSQAVKRLLARARSPARLGRMRPTEIEALVYPVGFFRTKARLLPALGRMLAAEWGGRVPKSRDELLRLPGVGRKVANIVLSKGWGLPAIAVDTHVHRISNRLGLVTTRKPEETEVRLAELLPKRIWAEWNGLLVALGQTVCRPRLPNCPVCPVRPWCPQGHRLGTALRCG